MCHHVFAFQTQERNSMKKGLYSAFLLMFSDASAAMPAFDLNAEANAILPRSSLALFDPHVAKECRQTLTKRLEELVHIDLNFARDLAMHIHSVSIMNGKDIYIRVLKSIIHSKFRSGNFQDSLRFLQQAADLDDSLSIAQIAELDWRGFVQIPQGAPNGNTFLRQLEETTNPDDITKSVHLALVLAGVHSHLRHEEFFDLPNKDVDASIGLLERSYALGDCAPKKRAQVLSAIHRTLESYWNHHPKGDLSMLTEMSKFCELLLRINPDDGLGHSFMGMIRKEEAERHFQNSK